MRAVPLILAFLAVGCSQDVSVTDRGKELAVSPELTDVGVVPVGDEVEFTLHLDSISGDIKIRQIEILPVEGGEVFYYDPESQDDVIVPNGDTLDLIMTYRPEDVGYHRAQINITSDASKGFGSDETVDVRGQAIAPEAACWPLALDYGPVERNDNKSKSVTCTNNSDIDMTITSADSSNPMFNMGTNLPVVIEPGKTASFNVVFTAGDTNPQVGEVIMQMGNVELPGVSVRANDCENGDPVAYDADQDGFTVCGGDCDDDDNKVHPGVIETGDMVDEDCDGTIDEGTKYYDDDGDGYCEDPGVCANMSTMTPGDCDDTNAATYPGAVESADYKDNDCDNTVDEGTDNYDDDGDGFTENGGDCDDTAANISPAFGNCP